MPREEEYVKRSYITQDVTTLKHALILMMYKECLHAINFKNKDFAEKVITVIILMLENTKNANIFLYVKTKINVSSHMNTQFAKIINKDFVLWVTHVQKFMFLKNSAEIICMDFVKTDLNANKLTQRYFLKTIFNSMNKLYRIVCKDKL